jgi:hypothetical protein
VQAKSIRYPLTALPIDQITSDRVADLGLESKRNRFQKTQNLENTRSLPPPPGPLVSTQVLERTESLENRTILPPSPLYSGERSWGVRGISKLRLADRLGAHFSCILRIQITYCLEPLTPAPSPPSTRARGDLNREFDLCRYQCCRDYDLNRLKPRH